MRLLKGTFLDRKRLCFIIMNQNFGKKSSLKYSKEDDTANKTEGKNGWLNTLHIIYIATIIKGLRVNFTRMYSMKQYLGEGISVLTKVKGGSIF